MDPKLLLMARLGLGLNQGEVAQAAGISLRSLQRLEADAENASTSLKNLREVQLVLERCGVVFLGNSKEHGPGLLLPLGFPDNREKVEANRRQLLNLAKRSKGSGKANLLGTKRSP